ncbi:ABC transporter permease [Fervidobacterium thailandense]|uniref:ABC transporter permease n=1 Tax=Fervidobacterium thailandense TaxID=1008305 RepID=A0A1E3G2Y5_9BACT|nr:FtsX-like permease family protein [Fervidobacterium thailandense]ODN30028.1 ABC transporter permease [Fervidobacterium thailandense]
MVLKIAFRNFTKHWKIVLLAIMGTMVATMLLVGGLSLNDSVQRYLQTKIERNLGKIDLIVKDKADTIFFPKALNPEKIESFLHEFPEIRDFTPVKLAQVTVKIGKKYTDLFAIALTKEFKRFANFEGNGVIVSYDTAQAFDLKVGDQIEIITAKGSYKVTINGFGEKELNFRGETTSANGTIFLPEDLFEKYGIYPLKDPNAYFVSTTLPVDAHPKLAESLKSEGTIRISTPKYRLRTSPLNRLIGYLFIGFSGFAVLSSFLFIASFFGILTEERKQTLGALRALGFPRHKMFLILFIEGLLYLFSSATVGAIVGVGFGKLLLDKINSFRRTDDLFAFVQDTIPFHVTFQSIVLAIVISLFVPVTILISRSLEFSKTSPVTLYTGRAEGKKSQRKLKMAIAFVLVLASLLVSLEHALVVFLATIPLLFPSPIIQLTYGLSIFVATFSMIGEGAGLQFLIRAGYFLVGAIYVVFSAVPFLRNLFERVKSVPSTIALAYLDKYKTRNFTIFVIYSVTLVLILISAIIPHSIAEYINSKKQEGAFGYNFIIVENPIKTLFGSYKYLEDKKFTSKFEKLIPIQLVQVSFEGIKDKYTFIVSTNEIFDRLVLPSEKLMKDLEKRKKDGIPPLSTFISDKIPIDQQVGDKIRMTIKGVLPGISPKISEEFTLFGRYSQEQALLPMEGILVWDRKIFGAVRGYAGVIKNPQDALELQEFVTRKFDGAFYITGEIEKLYSAINNLVNMALQLFYIGFVSGFAGLAIMTFRNVYVRRREIGMLRAIGSKGDVIFKIFIYESFSIVAIAVAVAVLTTVFVIQDLRDFISPILSDFKILVPIWKVFGTILSVFGITLVFVSIPASLSKRIPPSEALRVYD